MKKLLALVLTLVVLTLAFTACGAKAVSSITIDEGLIREYNINATPDFSGVKATVKYNDESTKSVTADDLTFGELDTSTAGTKQLTISYGGFSITVDIVVRASTANTKKITSITVTEGIASSYELGSTPDFSGIKATVTYNDGTTKNVTAEELTIGNIDTTTAGEKMLAITYDGYTENAKVVILPPVTVTEIIITEGIATEYEFGSTPDFSGVKATIKYSNGTSEEVDATALTIAKLDTTTAGEKDLAITYKGYTKYVDVTVLAPVVVTEIMVTEGIEESYDVDSTPDFSGIKATVKYSDGTSTEVTAEDLDIGTVDTSTAGEKKLAITYDGYTENVKITVVDFITGITVTEGIAKEYEFGSTPDFSGIKATVTYSDETTTNVTFDDLTVGTIDTSVPGKQDLKIEYDGFAIYVPVTVLPPVTVTGITVTEGIENSYNVGSTPDFSGIKATVKYSNGTSTEVTAEDLDIGTVDTSTAGEKKLAITYDGYTENVKITVVVPAYVTDIKVTEGIEDEYEFGSTPDFSGIKATITYNDGTSKEVTFADLKLGTINTEKAGTQQMSVSYGGYEIQVNIVISEPAPTYEITGALLPGSITDRNEYKKSFKDQTKGYVVGDDNPYNLTLIINAFDEDDNIVSGLDYIGASIVYLVTDDGEEIVGTEYVTVDELKHTFDFTEAAIGKTFRIVTRPSEVTDEDVLDDVTAEHTVTVVDGYNITNAKELNLITNSNGGMTHSGAADALVAVNTFLQNNGITRPQNLKSVILHGDIKVTTADLPQEYFHTYTVGGVTKTEFYDFLSVYYRRLTANEPTFTVYGNYYTIYSYELPCVVPKGQANNDDDYSSSELIKIDTDKALITNGADLTPYHGRIENLGMRDSNPNSNDEADSERSMRGLIGIKVLNSDVTIFNTNIEKFFISTLADSDYTTLTLDKVNFYNAWQGHLFIWTDNNPQSKDEEPWSSHKPVTVNIIDSSMTKCGGPVILSQNDNVDYKRNSKSQAVVNIDKESKLESWVTGEEAWFTAVGVKPLAVQIKQLSALLTMTGQAYGKNASYVKDENGTTYINFIYVNMVAGTDVLLGGGDIDGTVTIDGKVVVNQNDGENTIIDTYVGAIQQMTGSVPPVFQSSAGGTCFGNPDGEGAGAYGIDFSTGSISAPDASCFDGDYITLYYNGLAILVEYMH